MFRRHGRPRPSVAAFPESPRAPETPGGPPRARALPPLPEAAGAPHRGWRGRAAVLPVALALSLAGATLAPGGPLLAAAAPGGTGPAGAVGGGAGASGPGRITSATSVTDIRGNFAYYDILQLMQAGDIPVPADGLFRPDAPVTRLDFTLWLASALGLRPSSTPLPFLDTASLPQAQQRLLAAAVASGLIKGMPGKLFAPSATITRAQLAVIFGRELAAKGQTPDARYFQIWQDGSTIPAWALAATIPMKDDLIHGLPCAPEACFGPYQNATRAQAATLIVRYMAYLTAHFHQAPLPTAQPGGFVMGFWDSGTPEAYANLTRYGGSINQVVDGGYDILPGGVLSGFDNSQNLAWAAQHPGTQMWMMVQAMGPSEYAFLNHPSQEQAIIASVVTAVRRAGYAGADFDIEVPPAADRTALTGFITQAAAALHAVGAKISVDVTMPIQPNPGSPDVGPYDYAALGAVCDRVNLMTYSYHWPGGWPGPVAPLPWDQAAIRFATRYIPPSKVVLGVPAYGYIWNQQTLGATAYWVSGMWNEANAHAASVSYQAAVGENTFAFNDGSPQVGWFVGGVGLRQRVQLAHQMGIKGIIAWRLDYGVHTWWPYWTQLFAEYR